jgi:threonine aldolase
VRKVFGGGMRQAGYIAAAGRFALQHHVERLAEDHEHARMIAAALQAQGYSTLPVETNIIIFDAPLPYTPQDFVNRLKEHDILAYAISSTQVRLVIHLEITKTMVETAISVLKSLHDVS